VNERMRQFPHSDQRCSQCGHTLGYNVEWCDTCNGFAESVMRAEDEEERRRRTLSEAECFFRARD